MRVSMRSLGDEFDEEDGAAIFGGDARRHIRRVDNREDSSLGSIKMKLLSFQDKNDPEAYLEQGKKMEWVFDYHNYSELEKEKLATQNFLIMPLCGGTNSDEQEKKQGLSDRDLGGDESSDEEEVRAQLLLLGVVLEITKSQARERERR